MQDSFRKSYLTLPLQPTVAVATAVITYIVQRPMKVIGMQLCLSDTGTGTGATTVNVNVNGTAINAGGSLSIAVGAASNAVNTTPNVSTGYPGGYGVAKGDVITVDVTAVPGTTVPKNANVILDLLQTDE